MERSFLSSRPASQNHLQPISTQNSHLSTTEIEREIEKKKNDDRHWCWIAGRFAEFFSKFATEKFEGLNIHCLEQRDKVIFEQRETNQERWQVLKTTLADLKKLYGSGNISCEQIQGIPLQLANDEELKTMFSEAYAKLHNLTPQEQVHEIIEHIEDIIAIEKLRKIAIEKRKELESRVAKLFQLTCDDIPQKNNIYEIFCACFPEVEGTSSQTSRDLIDRIYKKHLKEFTKLSTLCSLGDLQKVNQLFMTLSPLVKEWVITIQHNANHLYMWRGAHKITGRTLFRIFAPKADSVQLIFTSFNWQKSTHLMKKNEYGVWEICIKEVDPYQTYFYRIDQQNNITTDRTDPFSFSTIKKNKMIETIVTDIANFKWEDAEWMAERKKKNPLKQPFTGYELYIDSWKKKNGVRLTFQELAVELVQYCKEMSFTHVELYGVLDHMSSYSWGYQVDNFFSPNHRLGNATDFQCLINKFHKAGIGVILDWIPHYKHNHNGNYSCSIHEIDGEDYYSRETSHWDTMHFDFSKPEARRFMLASALYWLDKMHIDGIRVDALSHAIKKNKGDGDPDTDALSFFRELNQIVHNQYPGVLMIAEETHGFPGIVQDSSASGLGFDMKIGVELVMNARHYFSTPYRDRALLEHHNRKLMDQLEAVFREERWMMAHSHDSSSSQQKSTLYRSVPKEAKIEQRFADMRLFFAWNLLTPSGAHMIHMGDEIGQINPWNERLDCHEGAVEWHLLNWSENKSFHQGLKNFNQDLNRLYCKNKAFWAEGGELGFRLISEHAKNNIIAYHRRSQSQSIIVIHNFSLTGYTEYDVPLASCSADPLTAQIIQIDEIFNSNEEKYGGDGEFLNKGKIVTIIKDHVAGRNWPKKFRITLPPLSTIILEEVLSSTSLPILIQQSEQIELNRRFNEQMETRLSTQEASVPNKSILIDMKKFAKDLRQALDRPNPKSILLKLYRASLSAMIDRGNNGEIEGQCSGEADYLINEYRKMENEVNKKINKYHTALIELCQTIIRESDSNKRTAIFAILGLVKSEVPSNDEGWKSICLSKIEELTYYLNENPSKGTDKYYWAWNHKKYKVGKLIQKLKNKKLEICENSAMRDAYLLIIIQDGYYCTKEDLELFDCLYDPLEQMSWGIQNSHTTSLGLPDAHPITVNSPPLTHIQEEFSMKQIAEEFWLDPEAILDGSMVKKINTANMYLQEHGFILEGIKADGNCFCNAFLGSYKTLSRKIPVLDGQMDQITYLRGLISQSYTSSGQTFSTTRADIIQQNGKWLAAHGEGDLLAVSLQIPIRILTVDENEVCDMVTFINQDKEPQSWDSIPEPEKPKINEYIFIVDLGGHFIFARPYL